MVLMGVLVAMAVLVTLWVLRRSRSRTPIAVAVSMAALLVAGCTSNGDTTASDVSSELSSAAATAMSTVESATTGADSSMTASASASSSAGTGTDAPDQAQLCQARDELRTSLGELTDPAVLSQGASAIGAAVDAMQNDLDAVVTSARPELKPQLDAVQASLEDLRTAVGNLGDGSLTQNLQAVATAASGVGSASTDLLSELNEICGP